MRVQRSTVLVAILLVTFLIPIKALSEEQDMRAGSILSFGWYEQDAQTMNGMEPIEWIVLDKNDDGDLLLMSLYALDAQPFHSEGTFAGWDDCSLRRWLNNDFLTKAFSDQQQGVILSSTVDNSQGNPEWGTEAGINTQDKIFLLSYQEVLKYLGKTEDRLCIATAYCRSRGATVCKGNIQDKEYWFAGWWLRSPGPDYSFAAMINCYGPLGRYDFISNCTYAVRPALWVSGEALQDGRPFGFQAPVHGLFTPGSWLKTLFTARFQGVQPINTQERYNQASSRITERKEESTWTIGMKSSMSFPRGTPCPSAPT
ncbi:MAG: DUF6273 domain-containing protein [Aristaeellaceae bacterium]